jgi:putative exporter of polyketide antibiotics
VPHETLTLVPRLVMALVAGALMGLGTAAFRRRDLAA